MKIAVCIKQVVTREWQLRVNDSKTWIRDQDASFELNEPDAYALEEALRLKEKHSGEVVVCSAGPARASSVLREALARGADRAIHVEADSLASADAFVIAEALAAALREEKFDLVLTGLQSDDQGFGQVGVVLAEKLGMPHATIIMEVQAGRSRPSGEARARRRLVPVDDPAAAGAPHDPERYQSAPLCDAEGDHGGEEERDPQSCSGGRGFSRAEDPRNSLSREGEEDTDAARITGRSGEGLVRQAAGRSEGDPVILVVAEQREGKLNRASWEAIAAAQQIGGELKIAVLGSGVDGVASELAAADVAEVVVVDAPALEHYTSDGQVVALAGVIAQESPSHVLLPHTYQTRDFAPALAARLQRALITDVTALKSPEGASRTAHPASLVYTRPVFQGKMSAEVSAEGPAPHFITCQIGAFRADAVKRGGSPAAVRKATIELDAAKIRQKPEAPFKEAKQAVDLSQAERIVAVGRGIKGQEHLKLVEQLAQALGAEIAASRPICDAGWLPMDRQIGSSGQTVAPKLYLALGISGAIQHLVGMKGARTIVAINKDPEAPIFEIADYGIRRSVRSGTRAHR